jgi:hypothetical protein
LFSLDKRKAIQILDIKIATYDDKKTMSEGNKYGIELSLGCLRRKPKEESEHKAG